MESGISQYPVKVPMIDIHTVGAGGGSITALDAGGSLKVGPESAGAEPGPICFGRRERITVTDANLFLGRLIADRFLGGNMQLQSERLTGYFERMAGRLGLNPVELAEGILAVANTVMERAIRVISVEKGIDPRNFTLFSFGGAGGMHAVFLARLLNVPKVLVPKNPGILSAVGMLLADVIKDYSQTVMLHGADIVPSHIAKFFQPLEKRGVAELLAEGVEEGRVMMERYLDMRYLGQSYEILVPFDDHMIENFHRLHEKTYGHCNLAGTVEIVNIRLRAKGWHEKPALQKYPMVSDPSCAEAVIGERPVVFDGRNVTTRIVARDQLKCGQQVDGPAILVEYSSTVVLPPFSSCNVDEYGNLIITVEG